MKPSIRKYDYRRRLPHLQKDDWPVFVSFVTRDRWVLPEAARTLVLDACLAQHANTCELHAAVVMPDHVHLVLTPLRDTDTSSFSLAEIMKRIKGRSARDVNRLIGRSGAVWQLESFDHVPRRNERLAEQIDYVLMNPVRARLSDSPSAYPWSWRGRIPIL
jgi:REP-associated tyrosine transposase